MVMALFAVLMLSDLFKNMGNGNGRRLVYVSIGIFVYNWFSFINLFYKTALLDPISYYLLLNRHFIPR